MLQLALTALSRRFVIALADLFCLITVLSGFWLAMTVIGEPSTNQLIGLALYAGFILAANVIVRKQL